MKFTLSWLKDHLDTDASLDKILETLTAVGLEVEGVEDPAAELAAFKVAYVKSAEKHPDADRLQVCVVETADMGDMQVVCGAPNARAGMKGVFAPVGSYIPGSDMTLKKGKIRGVESNGMLVSEREMGLSDEHAGIIELPEDAEIGKPFAEVLGIDDPVIEIALTPNRADCAGVRGIARDLAAAGLGKLKDLGAEAIKGAFESPITVKMNLPAGKENACNMFIGRYVRGVKNGPSPDWLQKRLRAVGLRPISALVDITNYMTLALNRPLHVFDADAVAGNIQVRLAKDGEKLAALDGKEYTLDSEMTVIADDDGVLGLGGVIGGEPSGCTEETTNVYIECAIFDTVRTAMTGRKLQIDSDARYRFERGIDPESLDEGMEVATKLVMDLCGGEPSHNVMAGHIAEWRREIIFHPARVTHLGGVDIPLEEQLRILDVLGFTVKEKGEGAYAVIPPSWRADVEGEADLIEEVLRIYGYDNIPSVPMLRDDALVHGSLSTTLFRALTARRELAVRGLSEAVTWSFMSERHADLFGVNRNQAKEALTLSNPISADLSVMRPSILANLVTAAGRNADRGYPDACLFEVGPVFFDTTDEGEAIVATGIRSGAYTPRHWGAQTRDVDVYDAKADAMAVLNACGAPADKAQVTTDAPEWYHPGRSGALRLGPKVLAWFGEIHPAVLDELGVKFPVVGFEVFLENIPVAKSKGTARAALILSQFQPVIRDFAFVVDADVAAEKVLRAARGADKDLIVDADIFDVYAGKGIEDGKKSLALSVTLQPMEQTLTDAEIDAVSKQVVANVEKQTGGKLRG